MLGQKYMGVRPQKHADEMFHAQDIDANKGHLVPVSVCAPPKTSRETLRLTLAQNFLNAQTDGY